MDHQQQFNFSHQGTALSSGVTSTAPTPRRSHSPEYGMHQDHIEPAPRNPFGTPFASGPVSANASSSALNLHQQRENQKYFHSRRVKKGEIERPWLNKKDPKEKWVTIIPLIGLAIGFALAGFLIYDGLRTVVHHQYCPVLAEDWSTGFNTKIWTKEAEVGGFGLVRSVTRLPNHS
jgi:hypothetical protein